jgi:hypothetical protein
MRETRWKKMLKPKDHRVLLSFCPGAHSETSRRSLRQAVGNAYTFGDPFSCVTPDSTAKSR